MVDATVAQRLRETARSAKLAESRGDEAAASEAWRRYRLIRDAARDPDELLAEGITLSDRALALAALDGPRSPGARHRPGTAAALDWPGA